MSFGVMFHHFHGKKFPKMQGSISSTDFVKIIKYLKKKYNLLNPNDFINKFYDGDLKSKDICLTFDDCLKSQIQLALPVLKKFNIKAFFFIYSSIFGKKLDKFEAYRDFRSTIYKSIDNFYLDFFNLIEKTMPLESKLFKKNYKKSYLHKFSFYTTNDRKYRYYRDVVLSKKQHDNLMSMLMSEKNYDLLTRKKKIIMSMSDIKNILKHDHQIGLHSHTHPIRIDQLNYTQQLKEYKINKRVLKKICKKDLISMSHPCGRYNNNTLKILKKLNIKIGFRSNMHKKYIKNCYEIPRLDHVDVLKKLKNSEFNAKR